MKKLCLTCCLCAGILAAVPLAACSPTTDNALDEFPDYSHFSGGSVSGVQLSKSAFGADATMYIRCDFSDKAAYDKGKKVWGQVVESLTSIEQSLSRTVTTSSVYKFNKAAAGEEVEIDKTAYDALLKAKSLYTLTGGCYNPGVLYSVDLYGFAPDEGRADKPYDRQTVQENGATYLPLPDDKYVEAFKRLGDSFGDIELSQKDGTYYAIKPSDAFVTVDGVTYSLNLDLSGMGKGYATDAANAIIKAAGFEYGYFSFSTSSMAVNKFKAENHDYTVAFSNPRNVSGQTPENYFSIKLSDKNVSTSGDYVLSYFVDGKRYCHIIDPQTGSPIDTGIMTATVIGGTAAEGDALTTALMAMGLDGAIDFINEKSNGLQIFLGYAAADGQLEIISNVPQGEYEILDTRFTAAYTLQNGKIVYNG